EKRVFLVILFTSFSGSLVSRIPGAVQFYQRASTTVMPCLVYCTALLLPSKSLAGVCTTSFFVSSVVT
ncbi:hypothetical protein ACEPRD_25320, partial [Escherichia coli]|uniref:hypothetical protein n=1 Tax=Escherichia coli TaxID=562 RepID=UPI00358E4A24